MTTRAIGGAGEETAARFLQSKGFTIVARNYHSRWGEIDLIATSDKWLVFAEVKTRSSASYGLPSEYVTARKRERLRLTAEQWLTEHETDLQPRFDIIEVFRGIVPQVRWLQNAFE